MKLVLPAILATLVFAPVGAGAQTAELLALRGKAQMIRLYGPPAGDPVVLSSGDGGWIHLGPRVAELLADRGFFVVGFDSRAYLESFTGGGTTLNPIDEPADYGLLVDRSARQTGKKPLLIGVSEGAGLSMLAAADTRVRDRVSGVIALGIGDLNELGWRWKDALIYFTHGVPKEPTFSAVAVARRLSPAPLAIINSTHDEFVAVAEAERIFAAAKDPKRIWMIAANDHKFSDKPGELAARLTEAIEWIRTF